MLLGFQLYNTPNCFGVWRSKSPCTVDITSTLLSEALERCGGVAWWPKWRVVQRTILAISAMVLFCMGLNGFRGSYQKIICQLSWTLPRGFPNPSWEEYLATVHWGAHLLDPSSFAPALHEVAWPFWELEIRAPCQVDELAEHWCWYWVVVGSQYDPGCIDAEICSQREGKAILETLSQFMSEEPCSAAGMYLNFCKESKMLPKPFWK